MPYIGQAPQKGDENNFKILDDVSSYTLTFDGSDASVVSAANDTITSNNHRFITGQRVTYTDGDGSAIAGLTDATVYFIIKEDHNTIKLATSESNAISGTAVNITNVGAGSSHTIVVAFDGVNTKFKATHTNGVKAKITRSAQLVVSINGVIQQPHDSTAPSTGFGFDLDGVIVLSQAPAVSDVFWAHVLTNNNVTFDISDNTVDTFAGDGSDTTFNLSKTPPNNENVLVTIDGVVQYPDDASNTRAYTVVENVLTFTSAPANGTEIQVRHIGFSGSATGGSVTGFYGRSGNATLKSTDNITVNDAAITGNATVTGNISAVDATFSGNLTVNGTTTTLDTQLVDVDKIEVTTAGTNVAVAVTHNGTGDLIRLYDGTSQVVTVDDVGNVGIGTDVPQSKLHIAGIGGGQNTLRINTSANAISIHNHSEFMGFIGNDSGKMFINAGGTSDTLSLRTNGASRIQITNSGVGIGTQTPTQNLDILGSSTSTVLIRASTLNGTAKLQLQDSLGRDNFIAVEGADNLVFAADEGNAGADSYMRFKVDGDEKVRIASNGRVGIGTITPNAQLDVYKTGTGTVVDTIITRTEGGGAFAVQCSDVAAANPVWALRTYSSEDLVLSPGGHANANEKVRIKASTGKVGIGTNDPEANAKLDIWGDGSAYPTLRLGTEVYETEGEDIRFGRTDHGATDIRYHSITSYHHATGSSNYLKFKVHDGGSSPFQSQATVLTLLGSGNVGIGTDNPSTALEVKGDITVYNSNNQGDIFFGEHGDVADSKALIRMDQLSGTAGELQFHTESGGTLTERLRILSSGELRIHSSGSNNDPAHLRLHCNDSSIVANDAIGAIRFAGRDSGGTAVSRTGALIQATAANDWDTGQTTGYSATHLDFFTQDNSGTDTVAAGARLRITSTGQLTMTNAATTEFIQVSTTSSGANTRGVISLSGKTSADAAVTLKMGGFGDTGRGEIFTHSDHDLGFATGNAAAQMVLDTSGFLGINKTTSLRSGLHIKAHTNGWVGGILLEENHVAKGWNIHPDDSDDLMFGRNTDTTANPGAASHKLSIKSGGDLDIVDGNLIVANGHGIDFSVTGNSAGTMSNELLDDYEEGSWTPSFPNGSGGDQGRGGTNATYTKIGNMVYAFLYMHVTGTAPNNSSLWQIGGLPFAANSSSGLTHHGFGNVSYTANKNYTVWRPLVTTNSRIYFHRVDGSSSTLNNSDVYSLGMTYFIIGVQYLTDS